jgi:hypothetical protein
MPHFLHERGKFTRAQASDTWPQGACGLLGHWDAAVTPGFTITVIKIRSYRSRESHGTCQTQGHVIPVINLQSEMYREEYTPSKE